MKTLALLLLLSGMAWGQLRGTILPNYPMYENPDSVVGDSDGRVVERSARMLIDTVNRYDWEAYYAQLQRTTDIGIGLSLVRLWHEYKDSCWADSVEVEVPTACYSGCLVIHPPHMEWQHKEATLPGFMDFIERRKK